MNDGGMCAPKSTAKFPNVLKASEGFRSSLVHMRSPSQFVVNKHTQVSERSHSRNGGPTKLKRGRGSCASLTSNAHCHVLIWCEGHSPVMCPLLQESEGWHEMLSLRVMAASRCPQNEVVCKCLDICNGCYLSENRVQKNCEEYG